jgi:hypothetical protein
LVDLQKVDPGVAEEIKNNGRILSECLADWFTTRSIPSH